MNINNIKKKIKNCDVISFDIFDTLIKRDVPDPIDVFRMVQKKMKNYDKDFVLKRINAERISRNRSSEEEITLKDIYTVLHEDYGNSLNEIMSIEKQVEIDACVVNPTIKEVYNFAKSLNKTIIITTDMYLDEITIEKILMDNGYTDYDRMFLSSKLKKTKRTGNIFGIIKKVYFGKKIVHIGDNWKSDFINAKKNMISACYIPIEDNKLHYSSNKNNKFINKFINNRLSNENLFYNIGYECLGPLLYGYVNWLNESNKNDNFYFLSRDGHLMMEAYKQIFSNDNFHYIYASRRGLIVPSLSECNSIEEMLSRMFIPKNISVKDILKKLGLNDSYCNNAEINVNYKYHSVDDLLSNTKNIEFLDSLINEIKFNSRKEKDLIKEYYESKDFKGNVSVVDVGWFGNMQNALKNIFGKECNITGYYLGCRNEESAKSDSSMKGYIFDGSRRNIRFKQSTETYTDLIESFFSYKEGSFIKMQKKDEIMDPVLKKFEFEKNNYDIVIGQIQKGGLSFVNDFKHSFIAKNIDIDENEFFYRMDCLGIHPKYNDVKRFKIIFSNSLLPSHTIFYYLFRPRKFIVDFSKSWKIAFLLSVFKINIPYYSMYAYLKKILKNNT